VEIFVIIVPLFVALLIGALAVLAPRPVDPRAERARLDQRIAWLEERLAHAREKNWGDDMTGRLVAQLEAARRDHRALSAA
jgi:hypothetical protein